ncbi:hypothetical protein [Amycolatopsis regifaucium]|uniref:Lipoprotein n=1 Tax=Amycolatopsis regifaucium TaxID=546365 RepID=A0A154MNI9_9PSEU|nr:hypothetical protein [Amycolatopsis regifaucium]KZB85898.1 hypothetical protein AVL48_27160 [Amycolatopsis regifaucium]
MKVTIRVVVCVLWATLALAGCASRSAEVDTAGFETRLSAVPGVTGALVEVQHPGLPTNTNVVIWLFLESADVESVATAARKVAVAARGDDGVRGRQVNLFVVKGKREDFPARQDVVRNTVPVMHRVAEALGLPESAGQMLVLTPEVIARLAHAEG